MRPARLALLFGLVLPFAVFDPAGAQAPGFHTVSITSTGYSPSTLTIRTGDYVTWRNDDTASHTATSDDNGKTFDTGEIRPNQNRQVQFTRPATIPYHDKDNTALRGTLTVSDTAPTTTTSSTTIPPPRSTTTTSSTSSTSTSSTTSTTVATTTTVTFPLGTVPEESTTSSTNSLIVPVHPVKAPKDDTTPTGPGIVAALLLMGTSGATLLVLRRGR